jgi:4-amino-4-deoxy-L-arabinose transferase-like glycosyltransferase
MAPLPPSGAPAAARNSIHWLPLFGIIAFTLIWFGLLAKRPLYDPDEGRYAEIPREMLASGDWVIPHLDSLVYLEKPPLQYWLTAATYKVIGESEFAARLWTGIAGYASLGFVFFVGSRLWGRRAGLKALLLMSGSMLFVLMGHQLTLDMVLSTWLLASLVCFLLAESEAASPCPSPYRHARWMLACWASMALAVLTKGLIGVLIPGCTLFFYAVWQRDAGVLRRLHWRWGVPLFAVIAVPWFIMAARANGAFLQYFFIREHLQRFLTPIERRSEPWWFFFPVLGVGILPWLPQALRAATLPFGPRTHRPFDPVRLLWIWSVFVLAFFSSSNSKLIPYVLPAVPALALLCASPAATHGRRELAIGAGLSLAACMGILLYSGGIGTIGRSHDLALLLAPSLAATAALLAAAAVGCLLLLRWARVDAALAVLCAGWFLASVSILLAANVVQERFSSKDAALVLRSQGSASAPVFSVQNYEQSFTFYLRRPVVLVDYRDEFALGLGQAPEHGIAKLEQFSSRWRSLDQGYALMPYFARERLSAQGLPMHEVARYPNTVLVSRRP